MDLQRDVKEKSGQAKTLKMWKTERKGRNYFSLKIDWTWTLYRGHIQNGSGEWWIPNKKKMENLHNLKCSVGGWAALEERIGTRKFRGGNKMKMNEKKNSKLKRKLRVNEIETPNAKNSLNAKSCSLLSSLNSNKLVSILHSFRSWYVSLWLKLNCIENLTSSAKITFIVEMMCFVDIFCELNSIKGEERDEFHWMMEFSTFFSSDHTVMFSLTHKIVPFYVINSFIV